MKAGAILFITAFILGGMASSMISNVGIISEVPLEKPSGRILGILNLETSAMERISPKDRISENQIKVYNDRVEIQVKDAVWAGFTDTNSMDPVIDAGAHAIQIVPKSPDEIHVGDIMSYKSNIIEGTIIHRVVETGYDEKGWYAIMKGDNLRYNDPEKVRFDQVRRVVVAIIY